MSPSSYAATRIRFDNAIEVVTSARLQGRAIGGVADTLGLRAQFPDSYCDDALESYRAAETRTNITGADACGGSGLTRARRRSGFCRKDWQFQRSRRSAWRTRKRSARLGRLQNGRALYFGDGCFALPTCPASLPPPAKVYPRLKSTRCATGEGAPTEVGKPLLLSDDGALNIAHREPVVSER